MEKPHGRYGAQTAGENLMRRIAAALPGQVVCKFTTAHLRQYFAAPGDVSPRTRLALRHAYRSDHRAPRDLEGVMANAAGHSSATLQAH